MPKQDPSSLKAQRRGAGLMYFYRLVLVLVSLGYLFSPWFLVPWGSVGWYKPFLIWAGLIAATLWLEQKRRLEHLP